MLIKSGQVHKVDSSIAEDEHSSTKKDHKKKSASHFQTSSGISFTENELIYIDPKECEPWKYANRRGKELGKMDELIESIRTSQQLQPALIRSNKNPSNQKKFEIIFGRRRHIASLTLKIPFLVIYKHNLSDKEAILLQDAENKIREGVGYYSDAILYKTILNDGIYKSERELAKELRISRGSLYDLLSLTKIPEDIIDAMENPNTLSKNMALQIIKTLSDNDSTTLEILKSLAPKIGKTITSPSKLLHAIEDKKNNLGIQVKSIKRTTNAKQYKCSNGKKIFSFKYDRRGLPTIVFDKHIDSKLDMEHICKLLTNFIEQTDWPDIRPE